LSGIIYVHRISDFRMGGISTRNFKMFRKLCGDSTLSNVAIMTNMWGEVKPELGDAREKELCSRDIFFKPVLDKGAKVVRHDNTLKSAQNIIGRLLKNKPKALEIQRELVEEKKNITDTAAGSELNRELKEQQARHRAEIGKLQEEMMQAMNEHDEETKKELEIEQNKLRAEVERIQNDAQRLKDGYAEERAKFQRDMEEEAARVRAENVRMIAEYEEKMKELQETLRDRQNASEAETARLRQELQQYQQQIQRKRKSGGLWAGIGAALGALTLAFA